MDKEHDLTYFFQRSSIIEIIDKIDGTRENIQNMGDTS